MVPKHGNKNQLEFIVLWIVLHELPEELLEEFICFDLVI